MIAAPLYAAFYWRSLKRAALELAGRYRLWLFGGCHANLCFTSSSIAKPILIMKRALYIHHFWMRCGEARPSNRYPILCQRGSSELFFCCPIGGLGFCFRIVCLFRCHITGFYCPALCSHFGRSVLRSCCWQRFRSWGYLLRGDLPYEQRLLLAIPFWIILMSFTFAGLLKLRRWPGAQIVLGVLAALILLHGLVPSVRYIYAKTKSPVFDPPLCATSGRCVAVLKTCCSRSGAPRSSSPRTRRVQPN